MDCTSRTSVAFGLSRSFPNDLPGGADACLPDLHALFVRKVSSGWYL